MGGSPKTWERPGLHRFTCGVVYRKVIKNQGKIEAALIRLQAVNVELGARSDVDLTVGHGGHSELDGIAGSVSRPLCAVPQLSTKICGVVGVENGRTRGRVRWTVVTAIDRPNDAIRVAARGRDRRRSAGKAIGCTRLGG